MPVAYQSSTTQSLASGSSSGGMAKPSGTAVGDVLVAQIFATTNLNAGPFSIASTGDTWTLVKKVTNSPFEFYAWISVVANASSSITVSWDGDFLFFGASVHRFTGVDTSVPQDVAATEGQGNSASESSGVLASGTRNRHFVLCTGSADPVSRAAWSSPLTERVDSNDVGMASGTDVGGTDTGVKSNALSLSTTWCAVMLALRALVYQAQATPSITLSLGPVALKVAQAQATLSMTLSLAPVARVTLFTAQATPSIRLSMLAAVYPMAQASPRITLSLAPIVRGALAGTASPSITLGITTTSTQIGYAAHAAPGIRLAFEVHAIGSYVLAGSTVIELEYNARGSTVTGSQQITFDESGVSTLTLRMRE